MCRAWEAATGPAEDAGVRVVHLRIGLPLDRDGGLLKPMLLPFRLGLGARLGSGRQYVPWIGLPDWLAAVRFLLDRADLAGPVNLTGPAPVTNAEFTRVLAEADVNPATELSGVGCGCGGPIEWPAGKVSPLKDWPSMA